MKITSLCVSDYLQCYHIWSFYGELTWYFLEFGVLYCLVLFVDVI